jgi:hypothetical protein
MAYTLGQLQNKGSLVALKVLTGLTAVPTLYVSLGSDTSLPARGTDATELSNVTRVAVPSWAVYNDANLAAAIVGATLYIPGQIVSGSDNHNYYNILALTTAGTPVQPASDATHWTLLAGSVAVGGLPTITAGALGIATIGCGLVYDAVATGNQLSVQIIDTPLRVALVAGSTFQYAPSINLV